MVRDGQLYECQSVPNGQFCSLRAFKPGTRKGKLAWTNVTCKDLSREKLPGKGSAYSGGESYKLRDIAH